MFAARANQENTIQIPQTTKSLAPKTPGGKTAFHPGGGKNNENVVPLPGKSGQQQKLDRNAFLTPANPRIRAPLGNKTTNAKALQATINKPATAAPLSSSKTRRIHPKIKIHATTTTPSLEESPLEREIEYMPPREIPMIDHELDTEIFPRNRDLSCLEGKNLTRGWWGEYAPQQQKDDEGELSDIGEQIKELERKKKAQEGVDSKKIAKVGSARAKSAVGALAKRETTVNGVRDSRKPLSALPTTAARIAAAKPIARSGLPAPGNPRFTAAKVASNSTIGYSKGRVVSRPKIGIMGTRSVAGENKTTTIADLLTGFGDLGINDEEADALGLGGWGEFKGEEEEEDSAGEVFQLEVLAE